MTDQNHLILVPRWMIDQHGHGQLHVWAGHHEQQDRLIAEIAERVGADPGLLRLALTGWPVGPGAEQEIAAARTCNGHAPDRDNGKPITEAELIRGYDAEREAAQLHRRRLDEVDPDWLARSQPVPERIKHVTKAWPS
jgi:hypothetical protein